MLKSGAKLDKVNNKGKTPLHCAAENNKSDVIKFLAEWEKNQNSLTQSSLNTSSAKIIQSLSPALDTEVISNEVFKPVTNISIPLNETINLKPSALKIDDLASVVIKQQDEINSLKNTIKAQNETIKHIEEKLSHLQEEFKNLSINRSVQTANFLYKK